MIVYNYDADLEVSDTCVRSSLLSWVVIRNEYYYSAVESSFKSTGDRDFVTIVSKTITVNKAYYTEATICSKSCRIIRPRAYIWQNTIANNNTIASFLHHNNCQILSCLLFYNWQLLGKEKKQNINKCQKLFDKCLHRSPWKLKKFLFL